MRFLIDNQTLKIKRRMKSPLCVGQLITPLTGYSWFGGVYAIDNGAFSNFDEKKFFRILKRQQASASKCLFVACPDCVGDHEETLRLWNHYSKKIVGFKRAFVAQNGSENGIIPWDEIDALFLGGKDPWKDSAAAVEIVRESKRRKKHSHVGRVNSPDRFELFLDAGADTCDGNGVGRYDHMLHKIEKRIGMKPTRFDDAKKTRYLF